MTKLTKSGVQIFRDNICTLFNGFNIAIGISLALVGAWTNMIYLLIIFANVAINIFQEFRAKRLVENLSLISAGTAVVVRDGREIRIGIEDITVGDTMILCAGNQVCCDGMVIGGEVEVNESLLTGESEPVFKKTGGGLLSGSYIVSGRCRCRVERSGSDSFAEKIASRAKRYKRINSELLRSMRRVTRLTALFIIPIGILLFLESFFLIGDGGYVIKNSVVSSAAGLLGMLPKGLVLITSVSLAAGVIKLSKKNILVQELHCIETLAHTDLLCLDKTGTITEGRMRVAEVYYIDKTAMPMALEQALSVFSGASEDDNATVAAIRERFPADRSRKVTDRIPFSSQRGWSGVSIEGIGTIILGAPERLGSAVTSRVKTAQSEGNRVLYVGYSPVKITDNSLPDIKIAAAIVLSDPIRKDAKKTLDFFRKEGVGIRIISGDNPVTVSAIAKKAGVENGGSYIDMSGITAESDIAKAAEKYTVFGRVSPDCKAGLVKAFQQMGHTVAMTGDGVNDVPALKQSDCGIAMAAGSDAARSTAQFVLVDSDFTSLPDVVMDGRRVVNNITRAAGVFFVKTIYSVMLSIFCLAVFMPFPFIPIQISLIDAAIEAYPAFFMSFEADRRRITGSFLSTAVTKALPFSILIVIMFMLVNLLAPRLGIPPDQSGTIAYLLTGFAGILALIRSSYPFSRLRAFLCVTSGVGFFAAAYLLSGNTLLNYTFPNLLQLSALSADSIRLTVSLAALCLPLAILLTMQNAKCRMQNAPSPSRHG